jgi:catechol 2,3-dioxygenase-like lactoylglutathione lyase family enzyme
MVLADSTVMATIAVKDIAAANEFYGGKLGLNQTDENPGGIMYVSGGGKVFVYPSPTAGSGQATCANWHVADIEKAVQELSAKGITFEHYEIPGATLEGDVHVMEPMKAAWFKDPDGNILGLSSN